MTTTTTTKKQGQRHDNTADPTATDAFLLPALVEVVSAQFDYFRIAGAALDKSIAELDGAHILCNELRKHVLLLLLPPSDDGVGGNQSDKDNEGSHDRLCRVVQGWIDFAHEKLYEWHWKDVPDGWREVYRFSCHLLSLLELHALIKQKLVSTAATTATTPPPMAMSVMPSAQPHSLSRVGDRTARPNAAPLPLLDMEVLGALAEEEWQVASGALRRCDMGLMMGKPLSKRCIAAAYSRSHAATWNLHTLASCIHRLLWHQSSQPRHHPATPKVASILQQSSQQSSQQSCRHACFPDSCALTSDCGVPRVRCPSLSEFMALTERQEPFIITDAMDAWPAVREWNSLDDLMPVLGFRLVPVELGSTYLSADWTQELMTFKEFYDLCVLNDDDQHNCLDPSLNDEQVDPSTEAEGDEEGEEDSHRNGTLLPQQQQRHSQGYLAQHQLFDQVADLKRFLRTPDYCHTGNGDIFLVNAWIGPAHTVSPCHQDPHRNLLCQVLGTKRLILFPEEDAQYLSAHEEGMHTNTSKVDVENPDLDRFPNFHKATKKTCVLQAGEMLYLPPKYWHHVRSLSPSISVSYWFS